MVTGWTEDTALGDARNGIIFRIAQDTLDYYIILHAHLVQLGVSWFDIAKCELDHHVENMQYTHSLDGSHLQCMCQLYIYLQDGAAKSWRSLRLIEARIYSLQISGDDGSVGSSLSPSSDPPPPAGKDLHAIGVGVLCTKALRRSAPGGG
jgi:hypothetical protein